MTMTNEQLIQLAVRRLERRKEATGNPEVQETVKKLVDVDITLMWFLT